MKLYNFICEIKFNVFTYKLSNLSMYVCMYGITPIMMQPEYIYICLDTITILIINSEEVRLGAGTA
jgi:hypothetical protein